jgi:hypothetical protein
MTTCPLLLVTPVDGLSAPQAPDGLELFVKFTASPATGAPPDVTVAVTVEVLEPSAGRLAGLAETATTVPVVVPAGAKKPDRSTTMSVDPVLL